MLSRHVAALHKKIHSGVDSVMATLIPSIGTSAFDSTGERRLAERLEQKLDADYLLWHNVLIGSKQTYSF